MTNRDKEGSAPLSLLCVVALAGCTSWWANVRQSEDGGVRCDERIGMPNEKRKEGGIILWTMMIQNEFESIRRRKRASLSISLKEA